MTDFQVFGFFLLCVCAVTTGQISFTVRFVIFEEVPNGTSVGNIAIKSGIRARVNMSVEEFETLRYNFLDQTSMQDLFTVNERNGNLYTSDVIDREKICGLKELCELDFDILVHSSLSVIIVSVTVEIKDKNDHFPIFPSKKVTLSIMESSTNGSTLSINEATDLDSSNLNNIQSYEIVPGNGTFGLHVKKKQDGGFSLKLVLLQKMDRETKDTYVYHIIAKDGGNPANMGTVEVNINVSDFNDNAPVFENVSYTAQVKEGVEPGTAVLQLIATDKDIGQNANIFYRFSSRQSDADVVKLFSIDEITGVLSVKGNLVYEPGKSYKIFLEASDQGEQPQVTQTTVVVTVLDAGNNKPFVRVNFLAPTNVEIVNNVSVVNVSESSSPNTVIAHVTVEDTDSGQNGYVRCNLSDESFSIKELNSGKGFIVSVKTQLDREQEKLHDITVTCFDNGTPKLASSIKFKVSVTDTNDNAPKFLLQTYHAAVKENNLIGEIVKQVSAEDIDLGRNAEIMYYLDRDAGGKFAINSNTGVITANTNFDREKALRHLFTVLAVDSGNPPMTGMTTVILTVEDKNDNFPEFDVPSFQFFVMENLPTEASVGTLNAKDLDDGENRRISFSVSSDFESTVPFVIFPDGLIKTTKRLDRESKNKYDFKIIAADHGTPSLSSTADVVVYVVDDNDNSPVFKFPNNKNKTVKIPYSAAVGSIITKVDVYDKDEEGPNSYLMFSILHGNEQDIFSIGKSSGNIYLKRNYHIANDQEFTILISAKDMGQVSKETKQDLNIVLQFTNATGVTPIAVENGLRNVIISIVVVMLTIIISAAMITVICLLRRKDKNTMMKEEPSHFDKVEAVTNENNFIGKSNYIPDGQQIQSPQKKKKEVSFSLDDDMDLSTNEFNKSVFADSVNEVHPGQNQKPNGQLKTLHLHQVHLQSHLDSENQKKSHHPSQFDDISETSAETTNSDSGKGGSDVDIPNCTLQDGSNSFNYFDKRPKPSGSSSFLPSSLVSKLSKTKTKNKPERSRRKNHPKSTSDVFVVNSTDFQSESRGHNSLPLSKSRHYENLHIEEPDCENETSGKTAENWFPSYV